MQEESMEIRLLPQQSYTIAKTSIATGESSNTNESLKDEGGRQDNGLLESIIKFDNDEGPVTNIQDWGSSKNEQLILDLVEGLVEEPESYDFRCPKCKSCITTLVLRKKPPIPVGGIAAPGGGIAVPGPIPCPSCLSFVVPIMSCLGTCVHRPADLLTSCFTTSEDDLTGPAEQAGIGSLEARPVEAGPVETSKKLDILKCIVYGGLNESITSLSVVISAAGADAATLNILALGLANLIGGLVLFGHGLRVLLKSDARSREDSDQTKEQVDQYEELLGQRGNFLLHLTVAVLSFLVFGLVPLVTFGFTFLKSDNTDLKLVAVVAAAVVCITILAIGKAYIQKASKLSYLNTIVYYVSAGLAVSGVSYIVGDLIKKALDKLGWFNSSVAGSLPITEIGMLKQAWGSY